MKGREKRKRIEPLITRIRRIRGGILYFWIWILNDEEEENIASRKGRKDAKGEGRGFWIWILNWGEGEERLKDEG